jgi:hypothetical protein
LDASQNTLTWEDAYYIRIMGNPALFSPLVEDTNMDTRVLSSGDYREAVDLGGVMLAQAQILEDDWEVALLTANSLLNATGSIYFRTAIPGLSSMDSTIFQATTQSIPWEKDSFNTTGINQTLDNMPESLNSSISGLNSMFGATNNIIGGFAWVVFIGMVVAGGVYAATRSSQVAMLGGFMGTVGLFAYLGAAQGNVLYFLASVAVLIVMMFVLGYVVPRMG